MRAAIVPLCLLVAACGGDGSGTRAPAKEAAHTAAVPGVQTAPVAVEPIRDVVHAFGIVAADVELAELRDAQAQLAQAEAKQRLAAQQVHRLEELAKGGVAPRKELEAARADAATAAAESERAAKTVATFGREPRPRPLDADETWVIGHVRQTDLASLDTGSTGSFVADGFPGRPCPARVDAPPAYVDPATRTAPARLRAKDPDHILRPGMTGDVAIEVGQPHHALVVPASAVVYDDAQPVVFVAEAEGRFTLRPVKLGVVRGDRIEIVNGLESEAQVAVVGAASLLSATRLPPSGEEE